VMRAHEWPTFLCCRYHITKFQSKSGFGVQGTRLAQMLDEDPKLMERRQACAQRLELYKNARDEIDSVAWSK
jgi:hypothetical protein